MGACDRVPVETPSAGDSLLRRYRANRKPIWQSDEFCAPGATNAHSERGDFGIAIAASYPRCGNRTLTVAMMRAGAITSGAEGAAEG